jgi:type IV pilus assembly protein PilE
VKDVSAISGAGRGAFRLHGFSLLELVIVVLVLSVLLLLAVPSYRAYQQRAQRAEAVRLLLATAACQERIRAARGHYDTTRCLQEASTPAYALRLEPPGIAASSEYRVVADPVRADRNDHCGSLGLDQAGTRSIEGNPAMLSACWGGR